MNFFTKHERLVLVCLGGVLLTGSSIRYLLVSQPRLKDYINVVDAPAIYPKINLNAADAALLERAPLIGPYRAQQIIAYRQREGSFKSVEDLQKVRGISEATYRRIKDYFKVTP